jgi:hypothetical protein
MNSDRYWSHALFDFVADEYGDEGIRRYLFASRTQARTGDAVRTTFGLDLDAFNAEFRRYVAARFGGR